MTTLSHVAAASAPYLLAVLVAALLFVVLRCGRVEDGRREPPRWAKALVLSLALGVTTYLFGLMAGLSHQPEDACGTASGTADATRLDTVERGYLPVSHTCRWDDGSVDELVPEWINPTLLGCAALAALCLSVPLRGARARNGSMPG